MMRLLLAFLLLGSLALAHEGPHADDPLKAAEHMAAIALVNDATATVATGNASSLVTTPNMDLIVPAGAEFVIDRDLDVHRIKFNGTLRVTTNAVTIKFETLIGNTTGKLVIPASANLRTIIIKARGPRDRLGDPTDVTGGIILHSGINTLEGGIKTRVMDPQRDDSVTNWGISDRILIPGTTWDMPDTVTTGVFTSVSTLPDGTFTACGNLTCSLVIQSESTELSQRGHVMVMHVHTGTLFSHVAFRDLGRTTVETRPTKIKLDANGKFVSGDENTIGRYPLHFHGRNGAHPEIAPHQVIGCVIENSPTHGLVNHGSHVSAQYNVIYNCAGSNLFTENGIEIGDFTGNLCVLSKGRQSAAVHDTEIAAGNFGWEGTTIWLNGPGVDVIGNHLYRAKKALIDMDCFMLADAGGQLDFPIDYMRPGPQKDKYLADVAARINRTEKVGVFQVQAKFIGNKGAGAAIGQNFNRHLYDSRGFDTKVYLEKTPVYSARFFNVGSGINGTYIGHLDVRNCRFDGTLKLTTNYNTYSGSLAGTKVHDISYTNCEFRNFQTGIVDRQWSDLTITDCRFENNLIDIVLSPRSSIHEPHIVTMSGLQHLGRPAMVAVYATKPPVAVWGKPQDFWIVDQYPEKNTTIDEDELLTAPHTLDGTVLYYPQNAATFIPFLVAGHEYSGLTNQQLKAQFNKAVNGRLFDPASTQPLTIDSNVPIRTDLVVAPPPPPPPPPVMTLEEWKLWIEHRLDILEQKSN